MNSFSDISRKCILPNVIGAVTAPIIFGQMHFLLISENEIFHEIKRDGITSLHGIHVIISFWYYKNFVIQSIIATIQHLNNTYHLRNRQYNALGSNSTITYYRDAKNLSSQCNFYFFYFPRDLWLNPLNLSRLRL